MESIKNKNDLLGKLRTYADPMNSDDDIIKIKKMIEWHLLRCPELLYALGNKELESELFDEDGNLNAEYDENGILQPLGEWDRYFGTSIRDYYFLPEVQTESNNYLCYTVGLAKKSNFGFERYANISFTALCNGHPNQAKSNDTGISRHDLIGSIIREKFDFEEIFGTECFLVSNKESITDTRYFARTLTFQCLLLSSFDFAPYSNCKSR